MPPFPTCEAVQAAVKESAARNFWTRKARCTAPPGKMRLVHIDPRDHEPTPFGDYSTTEEIRAALGKMILAQREVMAVYDDQGKQVPL